jgi:outer membrane protein assembly factor BamA
MPGGRPRGALDFAPRVRRQFLAALDLLEERGKPIAELIADELERDLPRMLTAMGKYMPVKTATMTHNPDGKVEVRFEIPEEAAEELEPKALEAERVD